MTTGDLPQMSSSMMSTSAINPAQSFGAVDFVAVSPTLSDLADQADEEEFRELRRVLHQSSVDFGHKRKKKIEPFHPNLLPTEEDTKVPLRVVSVMIADPDENLPVDQRLIYCGENQTTDLTDQELFYEIDIRSMLDRHNKLRGETINKKLSETKDKDIYLEPVKVRDLKMVVVTIAQF